MLVVLSFMFKELKISYHRHLPMFQIKLKNGGFDKSLQKIEDERNKLLGNRPDIRPMINIIDYFKQFGIFKSLQKFDLNN